MVNSDHQVDAVIESDNMSLKFKIDNASLILEVLNDLLDSVTTISSIYSAIEDYDYPHLNKNPSVKEKTKQKIDALTPGLLIIYLFTIFESYFDEDELKKLGENDKLQAYIHVRNSYAHYPDGSRALKFPNSKPVKAFDKFAKGEIKLPGIQEKSGKIMADISSVIYLKDTLYAAAQQLLSDRRSG